VIYLASPYSHPDAAVRAARFEAACAHASAMLREGELVYSPIVHSHPLAERGLPGDWAYWAEHDRRMLSACTALLVLALPGWEESRGVAAEVGMARDLGLPVRFVAPAEVARG
jgi:nucleoside 2-deoxyribosyltransferase